MDLAHTHLAIMRKIREFCLKNINNGDSWWITYPTFCNFVAEKEQLQRIITEQNFKI